MYIFTVRWCRCVLCMQCGLWLNKFSENIVCCLFAVIFGLYIFFPFIPFGIICSASHYCCYYCMHANMCLYMYISFLFLFFSLSMCMSVWWSFLFSSILFICLYFRLCIYSSSSDSENRNALCPIVATLVRSLACSSVWSFRMFMQHACGSANMHYA